MTLHNIPGVLLPELFIKRPSTLPWEYGLGLFSAYWWNAYLVPVRIDPGFLKSTWSWSQSVLDVPKFSGPGPGRSWISQNFPVLVRVGPGFLKFFRSWSDSVLDFSKFLVLVRSGPKFLKIFWSWSGLVLGPDRFAWSWTSRFWSVDPWLVVNGFWNKFNIFTFEITLTDTFVRSFSKAYTSSDIPWAMNGEIKIVKFILVNHGRVRRAPSHKPSRLENNVWNPRPIRMFPWMYKHYFAAFFSVHWMACSIYFIWSINYFIWTIFYMTY